MYIPKLRTMNQVVEHFKASDSETALTVTLLKALSKCGTITAVRIGTKVLVNLDECISVFMKNGHAVDSNANDYESANISQVTQKDSQLHLHAGKRIMRSTGEICRLFCSTDSASRVRKSLIKSAIASCDIFAVWLPQGFWQVDLNEFVCLFTRGKTFVQGATVPRIRHYEDSYHILKHEQPQLELTWSKLSHLLQNKTVTTFYHGNRWLVNIDEVVKAFDVVNDR